MSRPAGPRPVTARLRPLAGADWALAITVCVVPIVFMVVRSFGRADPTTLDVEMVGTIDSYRLLLSDTYRPVLLRSIGLSLATVALCIVVGTPAALALSRLSDRVRPLVLALVMLPSFVNFTVRMFAIQGVLATGGPVESVTGAQLLFRPPAVLIGMVTAYVPLFVLPAYVALMRVPRSLLDAAADLGAGHLRQVWAVTLPLARGGIATGAVLVGVLSMGEFIVPSVLGGNRVLLLGNVLAERGAGRDQPLGGAITVFILAVFASIGLIALLARSMARRTAASGRTNP
jgi:ABC-type spermidine/putrescine transport system permease subunit I